MLNDIVAINYDRSGIDVKLILIKRTRFKYRLNYDVGAIFELMVRFGDINLRVDGDFCWRLGGISNSISH